MLSPMERSRFLKIYVFASSGIVLSQMEIATFSNIAFLRCSEIVLSPLERTRFLKIDAFATSTLVLSPAAMHHSCHRISCNAENFKNSFPYHLWEPVSGALLKWGGVGGEAIERLYRKNRTERRFVRPCVRNHLLLKLEGGAG